jgi:murein L,D-transpeptidase YafK
MRVSYPNSSDAILKTSKNAGGAIMIHGNCVTIGCLPMTDDKIKELYVLCLEAKNRNRTIKVDIFPAKMTTENIKFLEANYSKDKLAFWNSLKPAYDYFEKNHSTLKVLTDAKGHYSFKD